MSKINLTNWEIVDEMQNGEVVIRSKVTGKELRLHQSGELITESIDNNGIIETDTLDSTSIDNADTVTTPTLDAQDIDADSVTASEVAIGDSKLLFNNNQLRFRDLINNSDWLQLETPNNTSGPRVRVNEDLDVRKGHQISIGLTSGGNQGSSSDPIFALGGDGAGLFKSGGDIIAVDGSGNTFNLTQ